MLELYDSYTAAACRNIAPIDRDSSHRDLRIHDARRCPERLLCCRCSSARAIASYVSAAPSRAESSQATLDISRSSEVSVPSHPELSRVRDPRAVKMSRWRRSGSESHARLVDLRMLRLQAHSWHRSRTGEADEMLQSSLPKCTRSVQTHSQQSQVCRRGEVLPKWLPLSQRPKGQERGV